MSMLPLALFLVTCFFLLCGFPVAFTLAGSALLFAGIGATFFVTDITFVFALPEKIYGLINNSTLLAVPLFILMGTTLQQSGIAERLLNSMAALMGKAHYGLGLSVILVGVLLAASTGIVGATVVTMGLISLPAMLQRQYPSTLASGIVCATGTLGQLIPPSIAMILLGDVLANSYQQAQTSSGIFNPKVFSITDLFAGALIPSAILVSLYLLYVVVRMRPASYSVDQGYQDQLLSDSLPLREYLASFVPTLLLIVTVLGAILFGLATPTEAAALGAAGALLLTIHKKLLTFSVLQQVLKDTSLITGMIFMILMAASLFSLTFRALGGDETIKAIFNVLPDNQLLTLLIVMVFVFLLGFILDFIEITYIVVPLLAPTLLQMGFDPIWLGILLIMNLQTSFLTPPFGFALFYLRGVAPPSINTSAIYRGVIPFIIMQWIVIAFVACWPSLALWLPSHL